MPSAHPSGFPPRAPSSNYVFRSFRSLMSIAARVVPFSRSFRSLIKWQRGEQQHIKVLQTLGCSVVQGAIDIKVLQTLGMARACPSPYDERKALFFRSAGPVPRDLSTAAENARSPETTDSCGSDRGMARDRPSPYDERGNQAWRGKPATLDDL